MTDTAETRVSGIERQRGTLLKVAKEVRGHLEWLWHNRSYTEVFGTEGRARTVAELRHELDAAIAQVEGEQ